MKTKDYKIGDRIFYECSDNSVETDIVIGIRNESYMDDKGNKIPFKWLKTWEEGNISMGIEDYNCLSPNDPKCAELVKKYKKFDKQRDMIIDSIMQILSPWEKEIQEDILKLINSKVTHN